TRSPSCHARGAIPAQRMSTSSRKGTSAMCVRTIQSGCSACARIRTRSTIRSIRESSSKATSSSGDSASSCRLSSSRWPRAIVTGVRSSCETSCSRRSSCSSRDARSSASASTVASACARRRACQTIARNIADINGTSNSSPQSWMPSNASAMIDAPVAIATAPSTSPVIGDDQTRKPYSSVRLIQMKWNGIVSHDGESTMTTRQPAENSAQLSSSQSGRGQPVTRMSHRFDRPVRPELLAEPPDAHVDDVRPRVEAVPPHLGEEPLAAHHLARVRDEVIQQPEFAVGQIRGRRADRRAAARQVEVEVSDAEGRALGRLAPSPEVDADAGDQLVERERLREVVVRAEVEAPQLRRQVGARREHEHREVRPLAPELGEQPHPVEPRQQQVEDDELVRLGEPEAQTGRAVLDAVDRKALGLEPQSQELEDPRFVLDDQDPHGRASGESITLGRGTFRHERPEPGSGTAGARRYPAERTVWIGVPAPSLPRSRRIDASRTFELGGGSPQTCVRSRSRLTISPACSASCCRSWNSRFDRSIGVPRTRAWWRAGSSTRFPTRTR